MLLAEGMNVKVLLLPDGDDPDSFARKHNSTEFRQYITDNEENFIHFKTNLLLKDTKNDPIKRAVLISDMAHSIGLIPNEIIRYACLKECASILNVDEQIIQNEIKKVVLQRKDEYLEKRKKEQEEAAKVNTIQSAPVPAPVPDDGLIPPPPFPPEEIMNETPMETYLPQTGWEKLPFYTKEQLLIKALVRYGEKIVCYVPGEEEEIPVTVTEFIVADLEQDNLQFQNPIHRKLLQEAQAHLSDTDFCTERYFLTHPDPNISRMAAEMISDQYRLSKSNEQILVKDEERLHELIPHLLIDFKLAILEEDRKQTMQQLSMPEIFSDQQRTLEVMEHYKKLTETLKELAKRAGDRVILKA
jgi:DNA primase